MHFARPSCRFGRDKFVANDCSNVSEDQDDVDIPSKIQSLNQITTFRRDKVPKANEIVNTAKQLKKTIFTHRIVHEQHEELSVEEQPLFEAAQVDRTTSKRCPVAQKFDAENIVYDRTGNGIESFQNMSIYSLEKIKMLRNDEFPTQQYASQNKTKILEDNLVFQSRFESGNLAFASKISSTEYNLLLHNDINTRGYSNWFYFKVSNKMSCRAKFNILNYGKAGWMFNEGVGILTYSRKKTGKYGQGWLRVRNEVSWYSNELTVGQSVTYGLNTLSFQYDFEHDNDEVYFSYSIPYTYTDLCQFLDGIQARNLQYFHRKLLGKSLSGNRLELITITSADKFYASSSERPAIVMIARSHPGQTVSSWIIKGLIEYLVSNAEDAARLRDRFVFKIIPMMNPDGVIHGNYRCSLSGRDLNRRWKKPDRNLYPQVYFAKRFICELGSNRPISLFLDLHGHSRRRKMFIYGCNDRNNPFKCREFPFLLSKINNNFEYRYCNFLIEKYKESTARVTLFNHFKIPTIFTLECSMFGNVKHHFSHKDYKKMAESLAYAYLTYFSQPGVDTKMSKISTIDSLAELYSNEALVKVGNEPDEASQSQPSIDNIPLSEIKKICNQKVRSKRASLRQEKIRPTTTAFFERRMQQFTLHSKTADVIGRSPSMERSQDEIIRRPQTISAKRASSIQKAVPNLFSGLKQELRIPNKTLIFEHKPSREVKFINFPIMFQDCAQFAKLNQYLSKEKVNYDKSKDFTTKEEGSPPRTRKFLRLSPKKKVLVKHANMSFQ